MKIMLQHMESRLLALINEYSDPRVGEWLFMEGPWTVLGIALTYLVVVLYALPRFMANRKPYTLKHPILAVNTLQLAVNMWIVNTMYRAGWGTHYKIMCQPVDFSSNPDAILMARAVWVYTLTKVFDLLDTVIFVLRKKQNQVSFLHLYHHVTTLCFSWFVVKFAAGGSGTLIIFLNASVHILMYTYYLLAAMGPGMHKYLWWKKYLTTIQMLQFVVAFVLTLNAIRIGCQYNKALMIVFTPLIAINFIMFLNFYRKAYRSGATPKPRTKLNAE